MLTKRDMLKRRERKLAVSALFMCFVLVITCLSIIFINYYNDNKEAVNNTLNGVVNPECMVSINEYKFLIERIDEAESKLLKMTNENNSLVESLEYHKQLTSDLNAELFDCYAQIDILEADIQILNFQIEKITSENQAEIDRLNALVDSKQCELDAANSTITELQFSLTQNEEYINFLKQKKIELESSIDVLNSDIASLNGQLDNLSAMVNDSIVLTSKVGAIELLNIPVNPLSDFEIADGKIIKYLGNSNKVNIPTSYSLGELVDSIKYFDFYMDLDVYIRDKYGFDEFDELTVVNDMGESYTFTSYMELTMLQPDIDDSFCLELHYLAPEIIPGSDVVINEIASYSLTDSSVEYLYIPDSITVINDLPYSLQYVRLPNTINDISVKFDTLEYLKIPASVTNISSNSLYLSKINVIEVDEANVYYTSRDINGNELNCLMDKARTTLYAVGSTFNLSDLPESVTTLAYNCLNNYKVANVVIPSHVVNYESRLFNVWNNVIESVEITSIPEFIDKDAFSHCNKLNTLILNTNTVIDYSILSSLRYSSGGASLFTKITAIYVPSELVDIYKQADGWCDFANVIFTLVV